MTNQQLRGSKHTWRKAGNAAKHITCCISLPVDVFRLGGIGLRHEANNPLYIAGAALLAIAVHTLWQNGLILWAENIETVWIILAPHERSTVFLVFVSLSLSVAVHNLATSFYSTVIKKETGHSKGKGVSFVSYLFPRLGESTYLVEALFWLATGYQMTNLCPLTGWYICACAIALLCRLTLSYGDDTRRRLSLDDLTIDGRNIRPRKGGVRQ